MYDLTQKEAPPVLTSAEWLKKRIEKRFKQGPQIVFLSTVPPSIVLDLLDTL